MNIKPIGSNQTELRLNNGAVILFSYQTPVAAQLAGGGFIRTEKKWSVTTSKHINKWLNGATARNVPQDEMDNFANLA